MRTKEDRLTNLGWGQNCWLGADNYSPELLGLNPYDYATRYDGYLGLDWEKYKPVIEDAFVDEAFTKRSWQFVLIYLMTHYNYIHE